MNNTLLKTVKVSTAMLLSLSVLSAGVSVYAEDRKPVLEGKTSEGIAYQIYNIPSDSSNSKKNRYINNYEIDFTINDENTTNNNIKLSLSDAELALSDYLESDNTDGYDTDKNDLFREPADVTSFTVNVIAGNNVKHTYKYSDNSFQLKTQAMEKTDESSSLIGYDGNPFPLERVGAMVSSAPLKALFGITDEYGSLSLDDMITLSDPTKKAEFFKEKGITGDNPLSQYMVNYYNDHSEYAKKDGTKYSTFYDVEKECHAAVNNMLQSKDNGIYYLTIDGKDTYTVKELNDYLERPENATLNSILNGEFSKANYSSRTKKCSVQFLWNESPLATTTYTWFYSELFEFSYGDSFTPVAFSDLVNNSDTSEAVTYGLADYENRPNDSAYIRYGETNSYLNSLGVLNNSTPYSFNMRMGLNGPLVGNSYQIYTFAYDNSIELEQVDGGFTVNKVDSNGKIITGTTGFNLYYLDDAGKKMYYALDGNTAYFTDNASLAASITTQNGTASVDYLMPGTYYIHEATAPEGYTLNTTDASVAVKSGEQTKLNFADAEVETPETPKTPASPTPVATETPVPTATPASSATPEITTPKTNDSSRPSTPNTGDQTNLALFASILSISAVIGAASFILKKKYSGE